MQRSLVKRGYFISSLISRWRPVRLCTCECEWVNADLNEAEHASGPAPHS